MAVQDLPFEQPVADRRKAWHEAGPPGNGDVYVRIPVYAGVTEKGAIEEPFDSATFYFSRQADISRS